MDIESLRQLDLTAVCSLLGLDRDNTDTQQFKTDGFRIDVNGLKWFDHNAQQGGGGAIDLTMHVKQLSFMNACKFLSSVSGEVATVTHTNTTAAPQRTTKPPAPNNSNLPAVIAYLTDKRGLNVDLVQWCIDKGIIYADGFKNCVFMYGVNGCELRGTNSKKWRAARGKLENPFILPAKNASSLAIVESAIDALSFKQLHKRCPIAVAAIGGNANKTMMTKLVQSAIANNLNIYSSFDNDEGGETAHLMLEKIGKEYDIWGGTQRHKPWEKDWNDELMESLNDD